MNAARSHSLVFLKEASWASTPGLSAEIGHTEFRRQISAALLSHFRCSPAGYPSAPIETDNHRGGGGLPGVCTLQIRPQVCSIWCRPSWFTPNNRGVADPRVNAKAAPFLRQPSATLSAQRQPEDTCSSKVKGLRVYDEFSALNFANVVPSTSCWA